MHDALTCTMFSQDPHSSCRVAQLVKNTPANAGGARDVDLIPGSEDSMENRMATHSSIFAWRIPMDRGAWHVTAQRFAKSYT